jgi:hypothetical protein
MDSEERKMKGLEALSFHLAETAIETLDISSSENLLDNVSQALLKTLMKDWGAKSYEFSLDRIFYDEKKNRKTECIFRAHCYFNIAISFAHQDSFMHLHCFTQKYGGSNQTLNFLLSELQDEDENNGNPINL